MSQVVIENPIINSPFQEPARHFKFDDEGITNVQVEGRADLSNPPMKKVWIFAFLGNTATS